MEWVLILGFLAGLVFPFYTIKRKYLLWIVGGWLVILAGLTIYSYVIWTPPPQGNIVKLQLFPQTREGNAMAGLVLSLVLLVYFLWPYLIGLSIRVIFDWVSKRKK